VVKDPFRLRGLVYGCYEVLLCGPLAWIIMFKVFDAFSQRCSGASADTHVKPSMVFLVSVTATVALAALFGVEYLVLQLLGWSSGLGVMAVLESCALAAVYVPLDTWTHVFTRLRTFSRVAGTPG